MVKAGQTVALMDVQDLEAQLGKAQATVVQTQKALDEARANVEQQKAQVLFARQELDRARTLVKNDFMSKEMLDQRQQQMNGATATYAALTAHVGQAEQALDAAKHDVQLLQINIADNRLVTPVDGRVQYKISNVGEVLPAGGKVFTMLDTSYVYMDVYLPTEEAGRITLGTDALITLDAMPHLALPAKVTFLATEAQFTPKAVETKTERDKFMFRVKVRVDQNLLRAHADAVRTGLPGTAYIRFSPAVTWPSWLQANIAK
jgi:HlyD family secretion protein